MSSKRILFVCSSCPYEQGDAIMEINTQLISEFLKQDFRVTLVVPESCSEIQLHYQKLEIITYTKQQSIWKMLRCFFQLRPLYFGLYYDSSLKNKLDKSLFDLIHYDFYPLTQYASMLEKEIYFMPDSMKDLALSGYKNSENLIHKIYWLINYLFARFYNKRIAKLKKLYVSQQDIKKDNIPNSYFFKIPANLHNLSKYIAVPIDENSERENNTILFRGGMKFEPNITAVDYFYNNIFLKLLNKYPDARLKVVGAEPVFGFKENLNRNVTFTGFVDDVYKEMISSSLHIVPMQSGTGVKTKMLDSIALKKLVFCTPMSINGIFDSVEHAKAQGVVVFKDYNEFEYYFDQYIAGTLNYSQMTDKAYDYISNNTYRYKIEQLMKISKRDIE